MSSPTAEPKPIWCHILCDQVDGNPTSAAWAAWLAKEVGSYPIPAKLVGRVNLRGETIPSGYLQVCVTCLPEDSDHPRSQAFADQLDRSLNLLVLCSPWACRSPLVDQVVRTYKMKGRANRLLAAIIAGLPHAPTDKPDLECFPSATRFNVDSTGKLLSSPAEPIAADFRTDDGGEGWIDHSAYLEALLEGNVEEKRAKALAKAYAAKLNLMKLKVVAGVLGVNLGELTERDVAHQRQLEAQKRQQAWLMRGGLAVLGAAVVWTGVVAWRSYGASETAKLQAQATNETARAQTTALELARKQEEYARGGKLYGDANRLLANSKDLASRAEAYTMLKESAGLGYASADLKLAQLYLQDKNEAEGNAHLRKAIEKAYPPAFNFLGECQLNGGFGYKKDRSEAVRNFLAAADLGFHPAMYNLGRMAQENEPGLDGMNGALKWYLKAAENKSIGNALYQLHRIYLNGATGIPADATKASDYLSQAAEAGHVEAQWTLGLQLMRGEGMAKNWTAAGVWLQKVASQKEFPSLAEGAQVRLAVLYRDGKLKVAAATEEANATEAIRILLPLAQKGNAEACNELGHTYGHDKGRLLADTATALSWHRKAVQLGRPIAKYDVAMILIGNLKDNLALHEASRWINAREGVLSVANPYPNLFFDAKLGYLSAWDEYREAGSLLNEVRNIEWTRQNLAELYLIEEFHQDDKFDQALALLNEASEKKQVYAKAMLSVVYAKGHPPQLLPNPAKAAELREAALAAHAGYIDSFLEAKDKEAKAARTFTPEYLSTLQKAAGRGVTKAQTELGLHYLHFDAYRKTPLPLDFTKAAENLAPGALNSDTLALMGLGLTYWKTKDLPIRFKLHLKAAQRGDEPLAQLWTGIALEQGLGTNVDLVEACKWYHIAFGYGQEGSAAAKKRVQEKMTLEQKLEARSRADKFLPAKPTSNEATVPRAVTTEPPATLPAAATGREPPPTKEKPTPPPETKKDVKPEVIRPELLAKPITFLLSEAERILGEKNTTQEDIEKALQYAKAAMAKNRSNTQAMRCAWQAAERLGDHEAGYRFTLLAASQKLSNSTDLSITERAILRMTNYCEKGNGTAVDLVEAYKWCLIAKTTPEMTAKMTELEKKLTAAEVEDARKRAKAFRRTGP